MSQEKVVVTIDSNEASQNPELTEILVMHESIEDYRIETLNEGDIKIDNCLFERKTPSDFAQSLQEGRLKEQVERMGGREDAHSFVLVEGNMEDFDNLEHTQIPPKSLRGMTASVIARNNLPVVFCSNHKLLADTAVRLARKVKEEPTVVQTKTTDTVKEPSFIENLFLGVEGIGMDTAEKLSERFNSIHSISEAQVDDFKSVKGIGTKRAEKLYEVINSGDSPDSTEEQKDSGGDEIISI